MKEARSIILAVVSAKNDSANPIVLRLARQADRAGHRTLGVIKKPDSLVEGSESERQFVSITLRQRLSKLLLGQIAAELPSLIDDIQSKMDQCVKGFEQLGEPRATLKEQRSYLLHISQYFQTLVKSGLDSSYNSPFFESAQLENGYQKRIRAVIENLNENFAQHINENGHYRQICNNMEVNNTSDERLVITREEYLKHFTLYGLRLV
ncbi:hypothetical protein APSETT445_007314 [Aspergillus pseudonomiae]